MLKIDIIPSTNKAYDCMQGNIVAAAKYMGYNYQMMFIGAWAFDYTFDKEKFFGERVHIGYHSKAKDALNMYHGIKIIWKGKNTKIIDIIRFELTEDRPVLLRISTFHCPWNLAYQKYDMDHFCLIIGIDDKSHSVCCIDPYMTENLVSLKWEDILDCDYCTFALSEKDYELNSKFEGLRKTIVSIESKNMFGKMMNFSEDIKHTEALYKELSSYADVYFVPIIRQLGIVSASRYAFFETLTYISPEFENDALDIRASGDLWIKIRFLLIKMSLITGNCKYSNSISQYLEQVIEIERRSFESIYRKIF